MTPGMYNLPGMIKRVFWVLVFAAALSVIGCDASNATSGYGGGAVGNTPPNPARVDGGNAFGTTGGAQANGAAADQQGGK